MTERSIQINLRGVTKGRPRLGRRRKAYTPAKTIEFEQAVAEAWNELYDPEDAFHGPVGVRYEIGSDHITIWVWELDESHRPKYIQGDVDNYAKSISDGLNGAAYVDDKQIHEMQIQLTKENPYAEPA